MNTLSIDTSTQVGSVALHIDGNIVAYHENHQQNSHSEYLAVTIEHMVRECGISMADLDVIAIAKGPGSYTGLRIGVSLAKGMCYGTGARLVSVGTLQSMAYQVKSSMPPYAKQSILCPMIDARRMEVYCQLFSDDLVALQDIEAKVIDETSFSDHLEKKPLYFFGNGAAKCKDVIGHQHAVFIDNIYPSARFIGEIAQHKIKSGNYENIAYFEPYYLKEFIAKKPSGKNQV